MLSFSYALRGKYYNYWGFYMKKNNKFTLRRMIAALGMVLMLSLSLTGLTQPAKALPSVVSAATSIGVSKSSVIFGNIAASTTVKVSSVSTYRATTPYGWIHVSQSGSTVTIRVDAQTYDALRSGYVVITSGSLERRITVTQYPPMKIYASGDYKNQITSVTLVGVKNKVYSVDTSCYVDTYGSLKVTSNNYWISAKTTGGNNFTITTQPNTTLSERRGSVTVSNGYVSRSITVIQKPLVPSAITSYPYIGPTSFSLTDDLKTGFGTIKHSTWNIISISEQRQLLKNFSKKVNKFYGMSAVCDEIKIIYDTRENINKKYRDFIGQDLGEDDYGLTKGDNDYLYIFLNYDAMQYDRELAVTTLLHEYRHAYQLYLRDYGGDIYQYLCKLNWDSYISSRSNYERYKNQFVEKDAFTYSEKLYSALNSAVK